MFYHTVPLCPLRDDLHVIPLVGKILHTLHWRCVYDSNYFLFSFYINPFPYLIVTTIR